MAQPKPITAPRRNDADDLQASPGIGMQRQPGTFRFSLLLADSG